MTEPRIIDGRLHSPYFIFVRDNHTLGDLEFIDRFGLQKYQRLASGHPKGHYVVLADAGEWSLTVLPQHSKFLAVVPIVGGSLGAGV